MKLITATTIVAATMQGLLSPLLGFLGFGAVGAIIGFTVASITSGTLSLILLYFAIFRKLPAGNIDIKKLSQKLKPLLKYGIPLSISIIIAGVGPQVISFLMASFTEDAIIGNFRIATNFAVFLNFFIYPIQTVLFPAFSKLDTTKDKQLKISSFTFSSY